MIKFVDNPELTSRFIDILNSRSYLGARIKTFYDLYKDISKTACFWLLDNDGAACLVDGFCTIIGNQNCNFEELAALLSMSPVTTIQADEYSKTELSKYMKFSYIFKGAVMEYKKATALPISDINISDNENLSDVYKTIAIVNDYMEEYLPHDYWLSDVSLKKRRGYASVFSIVRDGIIASTAGIYGKSDSTALIASVATLENYQNRGFSSALLTKIINDCISENKTPSLLNIRCEIKNGIEYPKDDTAFNLYKKLGFAVSEYCYELEL